MYKSECHLPNRELSTGNQDTDMPEIFIDSLADPRLDPYRNLKQCAARAGEALVAEGEKLVLRLLESACQVESVLCTAAALDRLRSRLPADVPVYVTSTPVISALIGFQFHRGVLACGARPPEIRLESLLEPPESGGRALVVLCPELRDPANLGTILRTAAAFGATGAIVGRAGTDPYSRRVLRTSMGSVLFLPIVRTDDWEGVFAALERARFETIAAVLDSTAERLVDAVRPHRAALLLGNEDAGLSERVVRQCHRRVTMPMARGVDSLNVAVAAGIILHHFANVTTPTGA
jgi:tRNA G18 (ribose-2'-O)-methylase SpoU